MAKREKIVNIILFQEEYEKIQAAATRANRKLADYIRVTMLEQAQETEPAIETVKTSKSKIKWR